MLPIKHPKSKVVTNAAPTQSPKSQESKTTAIRSSTTAGRRPQNINRKWMEEVEIGHDELYSLGPATGSDSPSTTEASKKDPRSSLKQGMPSIATGYQGNHVILDGNIKKAGVSSSLRTMATTSLRKTLGSPAYHAREKSTQKNGNNNRRKQLENAIASLATPLPTSRSFPGLDSRAALRQPAADSDNPWTWSVEKARTEISRPDASLRITYPPQLMESMERQREIASANITTQLNQRKDWEKMYHSYPIYLTSLEKNTEAPFREIKQACFDLEKTNTWALIHFRRYVAGRFPALHTTPHEKELEPGKPLIDDSDWTRHAWFKEEWCIRDQGRLGWFVNEDGGIVLSAHMPQTDKQLTIRVEGQRILQ